MKSNKDVLNDLIKERTALINKMNKINNLKYKNNEEFLKLGSMMCQLIDTQYAIMVSYMEILTSRILLLSESKGE